MMDLTSPQSCSICLEPVEDRRSRSIANLQCGHDFHLACIGAEFNARGRMICPNCRNEEEDQWLYASGLEHNHSFSDDFDGIGDDINDELDAVPDVDPLQGSSTPLDNMMHQVYRDPGSFWQQPESGLRRRAYHP